MRKRAQYYIENYKIEIVKTFFGKEKVLVNGKKVSERTGKLATEHSFKINENQYRITQRDGDSAEKMNTYEIRKDGAPVALVNAVKGSSMQMLFLIIAVGLGSGFIFGVLLYRLFFPVSI